jgi:dipeptidyl aminopeptidase/acylaminoacyl peptidase
MKKKTHDHKIYKVKQFFAIRPIFSISVSPNSKNIAYITNTDGLPNIWSIPINGGWASQVTLHDNAVKTLKYSPKKKEIIFESDVSGDENLQLFLIGEKGGEAVCLSPGHRGSQVLHAEFNKKGNKILFASNKRDKRFFDTYIYDLNEKKEECIYTSENINVEMPSGWSKDERYIIFTRFYSNSNLDILLYDRNTQEMLNLTEHEGSMKNYYARFDRNDHTIYFLSDYEREFNGLAYYEIKSGMNKWLITEDWDVTGYMFSKSGKYLLYSINENGNTKLKLKNTKSGKTSALKLPKGNCLDMEITPDEKKIVLIYDEPDNPNDILVYNIKDKKFKQITFSMIGGIPRDEFTIPKDIHYESFDGLTINSNLYIPKWVKQDESNPAVIWPHGGPEWQERNNFNKFFQVLTNRGYIVIAPNFRGSTGYGKTFQSLIYKDWGGAEFKDVLGSYDYLIKTGFVDRNKIAVVGGSFGGFMTLTCITKAPDLWKCAVDIFGPSNLVTFQKSIPEHWKPAAYLLVGDPEKDKELLFERSPINFVDKIKCPLLIVQGANDPRVVKTESDQIVEKLKSQNKAVEYHVLDDEGHGFSKVANSIKVWEHICEFLDRHLKT